jgi:hypothetical protein
MNLTWGLRLGRLRRAGYTGGTRASFHANRLLVE